MLPADLVKNFLFRQAESLSANVEQLYQQHWQSFDTEFWREEIRQGRLNRPRLDLFFQHYLSLKTRDDVLVTHVFESYKDFAQKAGQSPAELISDLDRYGRIFGRFFEPHSEQIVTRFFYSLAHVDTATVFPVLLEAFRLFDEESSKQELNAILQSLESFLVRRMVCRLTTKNYNRFFLELLNDAEKQGGLSRLQIQTYLLKSQADASRWPDDTEFTNNLVNLPLYDRIAVGKLRMILERIDAALENTRTETVSLNGKLTVEHLMPQKWEKYWPLSSQDEAERIAKGQVRDIIKHTIGNLTLLTDAMNAALSTRLLLRFGPRTASVLDSQPF